jgi:thioredoxin reductase/ferredoxin
MEAVLTTLAFLFVTVVAVLIHLRRSGTGPARPAAPSGPPCPRCGAAVAPDSIYCPKCGVPQQIFEMVTARVSPEGAGMEAPAPASHAVVRADRCVGCGTCVAACPEPGALRLEGKVAVVDLARCKAHGDCVQACRVGAIALGGGAAVQRVVVPDLTATFETNIPGLYIVGELGGRGLIKNAINEGKIAAEHAVRELERERQEPDRDDLVDVAVVGSGPAGLAAGLEVLRSGLTCVVLEQGSLADSIRRYPRHKILLAEPVHIPLYGDLWVADASKETLLQVWETIVANTKLPLTAAYKVENVVREDGHFLVQGSGPPVRARRVVLAMGRRGTPRRLNVPGEELEKVFYDIVEMEAFQGRAVLVVGGGDSAVESVLGLSNQPDTRVMLSYRGRDFSRVKERNRTKLAAAVEGGRLSLLLGSEVREIRARDAVVQVGAETRTLTNDNVIIRIGGEPPGEFLERIGVRMVRKDVVLTASGSAHAPSP